VACVAHRCVPTRWKWQPQGGLRPRARMLRIASGKSRREERRWNGVAFTNQVDGWSPYRTLAPAANATGSVLAGRVAFNDSERVTGQPTEVFPKHLSAHYEGWIMADPFRGAIKVVITDAHGFQREIIFAQDEQRAMITERVRATFEE